MYREVTRYAFVRIPNAVLRTPFKIIYLSPAAFDTYFVLDVLMRFDPFHKEVDEHKTKDALRHQSHVIILGAPICLGINS